MKICAYRIIFTSALILVGSSVHSEDTPQLTIASVPASVEIETLQGRREFIQLPTLRYTLDIQHRCHTNLDPANLSVSVADTRQTISADRLLITNPLAVQLSIPGEQIAPVAVAGFCVTTEKDPMTPNARSKDVLRINDILSLQAALSCSNETGSKIIYASLALDVELHCNATDVAESPVNN